MHDDAPEPQPDEDAQWADSPTVERAPQTPTAQAPRTGDEAIDTALVELAEAQGGPLADRIRAGEQVQRVLQGRLGDLGGA